MLKILTGPDFQPEKKYAFHVLLHEMLGIDFLIEFQEAKNHTLRLPNGAEIAIADEFSEIEQLSESWKLSESSNLSFDIFAATFFLLARLEETNPQLPRDAHGRFPAQHSLAWQQNFLHRPVVNEWADWLWEKMLRHGWRDERKHRDFRISLSCDVDHPRLWWSASGRVKTLAGSVFRRGNMAEARYWLRNHVFQKKDPYDVFDEWLDFFEHNNLVTQFNFMGERPRSSDCWYPLQHPFVRGLMDRIARRGHAIGFHASYESFENQALFEQELKSLQKVSPLEITSGRQHYLRFEVPKTWQMWDSAGLAEDSSLGYPEKEGFRCGICHDYPVFDPASRQMLRLREKPLLAMDVTLAQYRSLSPDQALGSLRQLRQEVQKHGGDFTLLWHNSSWNTLFWEDWKTVFREFITG